MKSLRYTLLFSSAALSLLAAEPESRSYDEIFAAWRRTVQTQLDAHLSKISGDQALRQQLAVRAEQNLPFLYRELQRDFFNVLILDASPLRDRFFPSGGLSGSLQERRDQWLRILRQHVK